MTTLKSVYYLKETLKYMSEIDQSGVYKIRFENAGTQTVVECGYDSQGRRFEKKVTVAGTTMLHHRYIYRGYLQIAALDLTRAAHPALWLVTWDPSQPTATRPLALQKDGTWFTYGYDITKNVCELFGPNGYIRTAYSYTPFGSVSASENGVVQNFQWSSEFYDSELDLVYYNYRHYSPALGRFLSRDPIAEQGGLNLYSFVGNKSSFHWDILGFNRNLPCCGGKTYNPKIKCCIEGKLVSRLGEATIVIKLGHNYEARADFPDDKNPMPPKEQWVYVCCTSQTVNSEFISIPRPGVPDHTGARPDCFIYPKGDDETYTSVESAYQTELQNAKIEAPSTCNKFCVKNVKIKVQSLGDAGTKWMRSRKPPLRNNQVVAQIKCL